MQCNRNGKSGHQNVLFNVCHCHDCLVTSSQFAFIYIVLYTVASHSNEQENNRISDANFINYEKFKLCYMAALKIQVVIQVSSVLIQSISIIVQSSSYMFVRPGSIDPMTAVVQRVKGFAYYSLSFSRHNKNIKMEHFFLYILSRYFIWLHKWKGFNDICASLKYERMIDYSYQLFFNTLPAQM